MNPSDLPRELADALAVAFPESSSGSGGQPIEDLAPLAGGLSRSAVFSFRVGGTGYVLRRGEGEHAARGIACLRIASGRGVAPPLRYADEHTRVSITERVAGEPFGRSREPDPTRLARIAVSARRLHDGPAFPRKAPTRDLLQDVDRRCVAATGEGLPARLLAAMEELAACAARYAHSAPCHNDLNPNNVLVGPDHVWFVDWDTAGAGDPFVDLAELGVFAFPLPEQREALHCAYLGRSPNDEERARATVARAHALGLYAAAFFGVRAEIPAPPPLRPPVPLGALFAELAESRERVDPGRIASSLLLAMDGEVASHALRAARDRLAACATG